MKFGSWLSLLLDFQTAALDSYQNSKNLSHKWDWAFNLHLTFTTAILMDGFTRVYAFNKLVNSVGINKHTSLLYLPPQYQIFWDAVQKVNEKIQKWFANVINWKIHNFRIFFFFNLMLATHLKEVDKERVILSTSIPSYILELKKSGAGPLGQPPCGIGF